MTAAIIGLIVIFAGLWLCGGLLACAACARSAQISRERGEE